MNCIAKIAPRKNTVGIPNAFTAKVLTVNTGYPSWGLPLSATIAVSSQTCWFWIVGPLSQTNTPHLRNQKSAKARVKITGARTSNNLSVFIHLGYLWNKSWHMRAKKADWEEDTMDSVTNWSDFRSFNNSLSGLALLLIWWLSCLLKA